MGYLFQTKIPITKAFCKFVQKYEMRHSLLIFFLTLILFVSCSKQRPSGVLSESKIIDLFTEVSLVDAYLNTLPMDSGRKVMPVLYDNLFKQFKIDSNQFKQNLEYYYGNPTLTEEIYEKVNEKLKAYDESFRVEDSIRNAFVQDSIRYISNLQQIHNERVNQILYFTVDTTQYKYRDFGVSFLGRIRLDLKAYGIQIPAITSTPPAEKVEDTVLLDSIGRIEIDSLAGDMEPIQRLWPIISDSIIKEDIFHPVPWNLPKRENKE